MIIDSRAVGTQLKPHMNRVNWRMCTNYAAAVRDANPRYLDDLSSEGIVAPPMLAVALTWPVSASLGSFLENRHLPQEVFKTQVHYSERLVFHRLLKPGDELEIRGQVAAMLPHRAGTHTVIRYDARDAQGELVFSEFTGAMLRGVELSDPGRSLAPPQGPPATPALPGASLPHWEAEIAVDPLASYYYDGCADIVFPIHTSPAFATMVGLPGVILQGTATMAMAARELVDREAGGEPRLLRELEARFTGMVLPGQTIRVCLLGDRDTPRGRELFFEVRVPEGPPAISQGYALVAPPLV
ncbi:MAG: MaoC family dehydratase N-terminal domain-containing protein [Deltaproteobacteria bacterium]|nr:MaoC family dehydratase N-terminal domain-containing protein [Deltaproteobacteria bacterium]